tara:strand:- start:269 stop:484 length:216 start_codon:yes stop_codon:yes gene_type:complete
MPRRSKTKFVKDRRTNEVRIYSYPYKSLWSKGFLLPEGRIGYFRKNLKPFILDSKTDYNVRSSLKIRRLKK